MSYQTLSQAFVFLALLYTVAAIGLSVPPIAVGDTSLYSSTKNLINCISYKTSRDDIVMAQINSGNKLASQKLNLYVFDSNLNLLRSLQDMSHEQTVMVTNLNSPIKFSDLLGKHKSRQVDEAAKDFVHICFDNVYYDKSWSFNKQARNVILTVNVRNVTTLKKTNYNNYAKYFTKLTDLEKAQVTEESFDLDFSEGDFDKAISKLQTLLNEVSEELRDLSRTLQELKNSESELRNVNESIYERYTLSLLLIFALICLLGFFEIVYYYFMLKRRKLI